MKASIFLPALFAASIFASLALVEPASAATPASRIPIDQVPMYGGMDRAAVPALQQADENLIRDATAAHGGRDRAGAAFVAQGFKFYQADDLVKAMARFNQAWLLDPRNPEVYWGFCVVLHDRSEADAAYEQGMRAYHLGLRVPEFLADLGKVAAVRVVGKKDLGAAQKAAFAREADTYFRAAEKTGKNLGYIYMVWASAAYWQEDYAGAWKNVRLARQHQGTVPDGFLKKLAAQMPEPK